MATAAGDSAGGAGGKFRRKPFRKPQTTPYDRPPTALRINSSSTTNGGWLSRIVDPASKLITSSAHKLFSSVFRKRLLPPPPPHPSKDEEVEHQENHIVDAMTEAPSRIQEKDTIQGNTHNGSMEDGVAGLEDILKQKTFTRSEIDHLTALLNSRKVNQTATETPAGHSRQNELCGTVFENGYSPSGVSGVELTPAVRSDVNVDDGASPTELAKAYMGSMSSRVSPSTLVSHSQAVKETTPAFTTLMSRRSSVSIVPKQVPSHKDLVLPRSRGRSAIYSMARAPPYSRVQQIATKGLGTGNDAFEGNSLSSQKTLKRRSSALESDIGSIGPIRRIRQKPNLLYPNATPSGISEASTSKLHEDRGEKDPLSTSHVTSKSVEMGQRILQQLDKLTPQKEKFNEKIPGFSGGTSGMELTPSMLSGKARKSLETVDSVKYFQNDEVCGKTVDSQEAFQAQDSTSMMQDTFFDNRNKVLMNSSSKVYPENGDARSTNHLDMIITKNTAPVVSNSTVDVPKRSPAFQMSAYEDDFDMDDDDAFVTPSVNKGKGNMSATSVHSNGKLPEHPSFPEAFKADGPAFPEIESSSNSVLKNATITEEASNTAEKGNGHGITDSVFNNAIGPSVPSLQTVRTSVSDKADFPASTISFDLKKSDKLHPPSFITTSAAESLGVTDVTSSVFAFGATSSNAAKSPGSNYNSIEAVDLLKKEDNAPTSVPGSSINTASFPSSAAPSPVIFSSPSLFSGSASTVAADAVGNSATATAPNSGNSKSVTASVAFPSFHSTFGGSSLASDSTTVAASGTNIAGKSKTTDLVNSTSSDLFGAAPVPAQGSSVASFQFGPPKTSGTKRQAGDSDNGDQTLPLTAPASTTERVSSQPAAPASVPLGSSFAFGSSPSASSSMAAFGSVSSASTNIFGGISHSTSSPVFSSAANNSSSGPSFGASVSSTPSSSASPPFSFGASSMSAPTSSSVSPSLTFAASGPATGSNLSSSISTPANGASNGVTAFGASSTSPASVATSSTFSFGASPATVTSTAPSSTFSFGASPATASSGASFSFGAPPAATVTSTALAASPFSFGAAPPASATLSAPTSSFSFGASPASTNAPSFSFGGSPAPAPAPAPASSSAAAPTSSSAFSFGASPAPASSSAAAPTSSSAFSFGASSTPTPSSTPPSPFMFGAPSASTTTTTPTAAALSFPFGSAAQPAQPAFGTSSVFGFGSTTPSPSPLGNNDQMSMEDSMVEDSSMHQSPPTMGTTPVFGQSPPNNFSFGMAQSQPQPPAQAAQVGASPFQFGGQQQNQVAASPNPFQASGSFDGGSFSLGAGGGNDKSNRRIVKVKGRNRKK